MTFATIVVGLVLVVLTGILTIRDWNKDGFISLFMGLLTIDAGQATYQLMTTSDMHSLHSQAGIVMGGFVLVVVFKFMLDEITLDVKTITQLLTIAAMCGAIATKTADLSTVGAQPQLHNSNILLVVLSALLLFIYLFVIVVGEKRTKQILADTRRAAELHATSRRATQSMVTRNPQNPTGSRTNLRKEL